jgi:RNA methyltransferase, TrmH family
MNPSLEGPAAGSVQDITSRDNPLLVRVRRLARQGTHYRHDGAIWVEGEHLCDAARRRGRAASQAVISDSAWERPALRDLARWAPRVARVSDRLFDGLTSLGSSTGIGFLVDMPEPPTLQPGRATVVLDRVQDAGNVGSILRTASALGFAQVVALEGTAGLWSTKVLRAGMGAHFALDLVEAAQPEALASLGVPLIMAGSHAQQALDTAAVPFPCAWVFGHEGQGVAADVAARCAMSLRIPQPGGEESLNVAAAAAICLFATRSGHGA